MSILHQFVRNEYGAGFVFAADPTEKAYHLTFKPWHSSALAMATDILELVKGTMLEHIPLDVLEKEVEYLMALPWDEGDDPKCLDMPDGDSVITMELPDDVMLTLMKRAHELDITFNQFLVRVLEEHIELSKKRRTASLPGEPS